MSKIIPVFLCGIACISRGDDRSAGRETGLPSIVAQKRAICGANSLYMTLKLRGVQVTYDQVAAVVGLSKEGTNLLKLRDASRQFGLPGVARKFSDIEGMSWCEMPLIAHGNWGSIKHDTDQIGHYVVVLGIWPDKVKYIDGTTGQLMNVNFKDFDHLWSGYALDFAPEPGIFAVSYTAITFIAISSILCLILFLREWRRRPMTPGVLKVGLVVLFLLGRYNFELMAGEVRASESSPPVADSWRSPENDGLNCLYILLKSRNFDTDYKGLSRRLLKSGGPATLVDLKRATEEVGAEGVIIKGDPETLKASLPAIAHIQDFRDGSQGFVLVFGMSEADVQLIHGNYATIDQMSQDEFRLLWSGYALRLEGRTGWWSARGWTTSWYGVSCVSVGVISLGLLYRGMQCR